MRSVALLALALWTPAGAVPVAPTPPQRALVRLRLGPSVWNVGLTGDAQFKRAYLTFRRGAELRVAPLGDLSRLRGSGIEVEIEPGLIYRFSLSISWLDPVRGSTLELRPVAGTSGASYDLGTGDLIDAVRSGQPADENALVLSR